ncbi:DNA cytosine methyltransferase [Flavobacterium sp.]|uniref:DNA cytosine methyltransferase n=1 Tax=Flavobacterium sp. TaxID=239 RepID=UPI00263780B5|nr:DNA cytosine methyltransferase [Flavobacterium sp.]
MKEKKFTVYSLFTGAGGFDIGFEEAGFEIIGASDIWEESKKTMEINYPKVPFICKDIRELTAKEILESTKGVKPDVFIGGPPCQGFSVMGDKNSADPRNTLFESYVHLVEELQPKCFVFENVKGLKTMFNGRYLDVVANSFSKIGYDVHFKILNAKDYGVPQSRQRVIIFGTRLNRGFDYPLNNYKKIGKINTFKNVNEAIKDLAKKDSSFPNHIALDHGEIVLERYKLIPEGGKLPPPEQLPERIRRKNFGNTYVRLDRNKISTTMVPGNNAFPVHPFLHRSLTPREAARIQTFPDNIIFSGGRQQQCILVGNAVPPLMAANIAVEVKNHLIGKNYSPKSEHLLLKKHSKIVIEENKVSSKKLTFIDLFSGAGGIGIGFNKAGFKQIFSADFDPNVAATHRNYHKSIPFIEGDLSAPEVFEDIKNRFGDQEIDLIVGGPPCQGFSSFGKRKRINIGGYDPHDDERNKLVFTYLEYVKLFKPKWFLMENVKGITTLDDGYFIKKLIEEIETLGYKNHDYRIINTADYGVPQKRLRFILIANRTGNIIPWPKPKFFEAHAKASKKYRTVGSVITDLDTDNAYKKHFNHEPMNHSNDVVERFSYIKEGEKIDTETLPEHLKHSRTGKLIQSFSKVFFRLDRNKPSHTLVPGHSAFPIHPWLNRQLTVREAARIQTFPDDIEFLGSHGQQCKQVGNAFPPIAAEYLANNIEKAIINDWKDDNTSNLAYYSLVDIKK